MNPLGTFPKNFRIEIPCSCGFPIESFILSYLPIHGYIYFKKCKKCNGKTEMTRQALPSKGYTVIEVDPTLPEPRDESEIIMRI